MGCKSTRIYLEVGKNYEVDGSRVTRRGSSPEKKRARRVEGPNTLLPTHSATLFPRGSLRPKFIARGNAPPLLLYPPCPPLISITAAFTPSFLSSPSSSSTSRLSSISLSLSVPIEGHDNHDPREISNAPRLLRAASSISRREPPSSLLLPHPLLAVRGTASSSNGITRKHETLRRDNLVRGPRLSFERAVVGNFQRQFHATTPPSFPAGHSLHQFPAGIVAKLRGSLCLSSGVALIHRIFEFRAKFVKRGREKFSFSLRVKFEGNGDKGGKIMARIKLRN